MSLAFPPEVFIVPGPLRSSVSAPRTMLCQAGHALPALPALQPVSILPAWEPLLISVRCLAQ